MKKNTVVLSAFFLLFGFTGRTLARDVCVEGNGVTIVFRKVADLKPGGVIPLTGLDVTPSPGAPFPCSGAAAMNAAGSSIQIGIHCYTMLAGNSFDWAWTATDETFAGTGKDDENGDNLAEDPVTVTSIDCGTVGVP